MDRIDARAAYCGLYCGACPVYLATRSEGGLADGKGGALVCDGCRSGRLPEWCAECALKSCARARELAFCGECPDYPCGKYAGFRDAAEYPYHLDCPGHLLAMKSGGVPSWLAAMEAKYRCPRCATSVSWWSGACPSCGSPVSGHAKPPRD